MPPIPTARAAAPRVLPFALPQLHVGTDICHVTRVYAILAKSRATTSSSPPTSPSPKQTTAARFIRRVLTPPEVHALGPAPSSPVPPTISAHAAVALLAGGHRLPGDVASDDIPNVYSPLWRAAQFLAGRFAAKEAAIKAHPHLRGLTLHDVRIARRFEGEPDAEDALVRKGSGPPLAFVWVPSAGDEPVEQEARLSISHDGEYATAVCLGVEHS